MNEQLTKADDKRVTLPEIARITGATYRTVAAYAQRAGWTENGKQTLLDEKQAAIIIEAMKATDGQGQNQTLQENLQGVETSESRHVRIAVLAKRQLEVSEQLQAELRAEIDELRAENNLQRHIIGELTPAKDYVDHILSCPGTLTITQIAADYGMSAKKLNRILRDEGIQHLVNDQWILYAEHMSKGYTRSETIQIVRSDGRPDTKMFTRWTQKGRLRINEILNQRGIYANADFISQVAA